MSTFGTTQSSMRPIPIPLPVLDEEISSPTTSPHPPPGAEDSSMVHPTEDELGIDSERGEIEILSSDEEEMRIASSGDEEEVGSIGKRPPEPSQLSQGIGSVGLRPVQRRLRQPSITSFFAGPVHLGRDRVDVGAKPSRSRDADADEEEGAVLAGGESRGGGGGKGGDVANLAGPYIPEYKLTENTPAGRKKESELRRDALKQKERRRL
ncbi:hypothetical protein HK102_005178 [Quaeritorhiza haematococci]|nr:hypothetical protein HK102_005178 [Quaeritorhiza haematococci]